MVCIEDSEFGVIFKEDYDKILKLYQNEKEKNTISFFEKNFFQNSLSLTKETIWNFKYWF